MKQRIIQRHIFIEEAENVGYVACIKNWNADFSFIESFNNFFFAL